MDGTRNIIIAIITNKPPDVAADMLLRLFGVPEEPEQRATNGGARRPRGGAMPTAPPLKSIEPDAYYSVEVVRQHTGYSPTHVYRLIDRDKVVSKIDEEHGHRVVLGADILRLRKLRGAVDEPTITDQT